MSERELDQAAERLLDRMKEWSGVIGDSDEDAYDWEVREPGDDGRPRLKFALLPRCSRRVAWPRCCREPRQRPGYPLPACQA